MLLPFGQPDGTEAVNQGAQRRGTERQPVVAEEGVQGDGGVGEAGEDERVDGADRCQDECQKGTAVPVERLDGPQPGRGGKRRAAEERKGCEEAADADGVQLLGDLFRAAQAVGTDAVQRVVPLSDRRTHQSERHQAERDPAPEIRAVSAHPAADGDR